MNTRQTASQRVAVVEADAALRRTIRSQLQSRAFRIGAAASADAVLSSGRLDEIGRLIVEVRMPGKLPGCPTRRSRGRGPLFPRPRAC